MLRIRFHIFLDISLLILQNKGKVYVNIERFYVCKRGKLTMVKNTIRPNHMHVYWHDYTGGSKDLPLLEAGLTEKSILVGRIGLMLLSCGTGAWRVRST